MSMRAAVMREGRFEVEPRPIPKPGPGNVLARVRACGICGSDLHYFHHAPEIIARAKGLGADTSAMERTLREGPVLGHEFVCEIVDFGPGATRALPAGTRVVSMPFVLRDGAPVLVGSSPETPGAYAEYMELTEALLLPAPDSVPDEAAALVEPFGIAVHAVNKAALRGDETCVVVGCGPIGLAVAGVLRARGFEAILAADLSPRRRELALALGATVAVDPRRDSVLALAADQAAGRPVVVFENTGAAGMLHRLVLEAPKDSRIVVTGIAAGDESLLPMVAITKELQLQFVIYYTAEEFAEALQLIAGGRVAWRAMLTGEVGLDGVTQAFADLSDPEQHAKILVRPWTD
ncbi:MAG: zinc-binding dehydrogenase [Phenylobacterium sp.]|uniref:zinc-binding dehydrogenase n=1 Tax=Phenylobacterium sp. TaxID=1871053 RepID=UPI001A4FE176|nr:zinc-binding dehydrogenase [Phenylobacterium sp.]MBL8772977.1 zinc-binding dehydrogenase [Phenylobacterium sp.]